MPHHALLQTDDPAPKKLIAALRRENLKVYAAACSADLLQHLAHTRADLVLLHLTKARGAWVETCRQIRSLTVVPLLIFGGHVPDREIVQALQAGADLFVAGEPDNAVIAAQVDACLRRLEALGDSQERTTAHRKLASADGRLQLDLAMRTVHLDGVPIALTKTEYQLLTFLAQHAGYAIPYDQIMEYVWGWETDHRGSVHTCVAAIRRKLDDEPEHAIYIVNEFGFGYRLCRLVPVDPCPVPTLALPSLQSQPSPFLIRDTLSENADLAPESWEI